MVEITYEEFKMQLSLGLLSPYQIQQISERTLDIRILECLFTYQKGNWHWQIIQNPSCPFHLFVKCRFGSSKYKNSGLSIASAMIVAKKVPYNIPFIDIPFIDIPYVFRSNEWLVGIISK